jgi:hypothetical protein
MTSGKMTERGLQRVNADHEKRVRWQEFKKASKQGSHRTQSSTEYATEFHRVGKWRCAQAVPIGAPDSRAKRQKKSTL